MLFPYQYVPHKMEKMQEFIDYIFYDVWCKAPHVGPFDLALFNAKPDLKKVMTAFYYSDAAGADFFYGHVESIYGLFASLPQQQIDQLKEWYQANNNIEKVCANDSAIQIVRYIDIEAIHTGLCEQLASFFKGLYSKNLLELSALRDKIGLIDEHYQEFMQANTNGKCPFCGLGDVKGIHHTKREAYDHYLPKALYPFNSINFRNLAPACHECNSTYKLSKDPVHNSAGRRKAFYPYATTGHGIEINIQLSTLNIDKLVPSDIQLTFGPDTIHEEIETWKEVYGIEERYKAKCCSESDGRYWLQQLLDEWQVDGRTPAEFMTTLTRQALQNPYADSNFLKKAFLESCARAGLF